MRAKLVGAAGRWAWSSARAHVTGVDPTGVLCFEQFNRWSLDWGAFLRAPIEAEKVAVTWERVRSGSLWNRPAWDLLVAKEVAGERWAEFWGLGLLRRGRVDVSMAS